MAKNLWAIHQTFSTKGIAQLLDIDLEALRSRQTDKPNNDSEASTKKRFSKAPNISSDIKIEEFKNLQLEDHRLCN
jgi:hypothetical protein